MYKKIDDRAIKFFNSENELMNSLTIRDQNTKYLRVSAKECIVWFGTYVPETDTLELISTNEFERSSRKVLPAHRLNDAMRHTGSTGTHLFLSVKAEKGPDAFYSISAVAKLSLLNRCNIGIKGELDDTTNLYWGAPMVMVLNRGLRGISSRARTLQLCIVNDKVIGVMSSRYSPAPQKELIVTAKNTLCDALDCTSAYVADGTISDAGYTATFALNKSATVCGRNADLFLHVRNSDNSEESLRFIPCIALARGGKKRLYRFAESDYAVRHLGITTEHFRSGVETAFQKLQSLPALMEKAETTLLNYPTTFLDNVIHKLNYNYHKGGAKLPKNLVTSITQYVEMAVEEKIYGENISVLDVLNIFLMHIEDLESETEYKEKLSATAMQIIFLKYDELDVHHKTR